MGNSSSAGALCGGAAVVEPSSDWVWSPHAVPSQSCMSPPMQNNAQMCAGDPTSVVLQSSGQPECISARMPDCQFNMHDLDQLDFDVSMIGCKGTWAAPLWMSPDHWEGGGRSGEIDMMENCPADEIHNNFAGGGTEAKVDGDANDFRGHTTMWKKADGNGVMSIYVKTCNPSDVDASGACPKGGEAYLRDIHGLNGCSVGNCMYTMITDIWNGNSGDGGYESCAGGNTHASSGCSVSVTNIRMKATAGVFVGKCAALVATSGQALLV